MLTSTLLASFYYLIQSIESIKTFKIPYLWSLLFAFFTVFAFYLHNLSVFFIFAEIVYFGVNFIQWLRKKESVRTNQQKIIVYVLSLSFIIALLCIPGILILYAQSKNVFGNFWLDFHPIYSLKFLPDLSSGLSLLGLFAKPTWLPFLLPIMGMALLFIGTFSSVTKKFWIYFFWAPLILIYLVSFIRPFFYVRYLSFLNPYLIILIFSGVFFIFSRNKKMGICIAVLFIGLQSYVYHTYVFNNLELKPHYQELTAYIDEHALPPDQIFHADATTFLSFTYYFKGVQEDTIYDPYNTTPYFLGKAILEGNNFTRTPESFHAERIWFITSSQKTNSEAEQFLKRKNYNLIEEKTFINDLKSELWVKRY